MASRRSFTKESRAALTALVADEDAKLSGRGFVRADSDADSPIWLARGPLPLTEIMVQTPVAPVYGGLQMSVHVQLRLRRDPLVAICPEPARAWWLEVLGDPAVPLLRAVNLDDRQDLPSGPALGVDLENPSSCVDDYLIDTLDGVAARAIAACSTPDGLAHWGATPQVFGSFHGTIVRSCVVELCVLGRPDLSAQVRAAFERGPRPRQDEDDPQAWPTFVAWVDSVSPAQWQALAQE